LFVGSTGADIKSLCFVEVQVGLERGFEKCEEFGKYMWDGDGEGEEAEGKDESCRKESTP
jgi:hypothetical protein